MTVIYKRYIMGGHCCWILNGLSYILDLSLNPLDLLEDILHTLHIWFRAICCNWDNFILLTQDGEARTNLRTWHSTCMGPDSDSLAHQVLPYYSRQTFFPTLYVLPVAIDISVNFICWQITLISCHQQEIYRFIREEPKMGGFTDQDIWELASG